MGSEAIFYIGEVGYGKMNKFDCGYEWISLTGKLYGSVQVNAVIIVSCLGVVCCVSFWCVTCWDKYSKLLVDKASKKGELGYLLWYERLFLVMSYHNICVENR